MNEAQGIDDDVVFKGTSVDFDVTSSIRVYNSPLSTFNVIDTGEKRG